MSDGHSIHELRGELRAYRTDGALAHVEVRRLRTKLAEAQHHLRIANARAWRVVEGRNAPEREAAVADATDEERSAVALAEIAVDHGKALIRQRDNDVSTIQTEAKLAEIEFRLAGTGMIP